MYNIKYVEGLYFLLIFMFFKLLCVTGTFFPELLLSQSLFTQAILINVHVYNWPEGKSY
jgi:hypothetical protein